LAQHPLTQVPSPLQAVQTLTTLQALYIHNGQGLTSRTLCTLSMLNGLVTLDLRGCSKMSWHGLREAWVAARATYEADRSQAVSAQLGQGGGVWRQPSNGAALAATSRLGKQPSAAAAKAAPAGLWKQPSAAATAVAAAELGRQPAAPVTMQSVAAGLWKQPSSAAVQAAAAAALARQPSGGLAHAAAWTPRGPSSRLQSPLTRGGSGMAQVVRDGAGGDEGGSPLRSGSPLLRHPSTASAAKLLKHAAMNSAAGVAAAARLGGGGGGLIRHASTAAHLAPQPPGASPPAGPSLNVTAAGGGSGGGVWRQVSSVQAALQAYVASVQELSISDASTSSSCVAENDAMDWQSAAIAVAAAAAAAPAAPAASPSPAPEMPFPKLRNLVVTCGDGFAAKGMQEMAAVACLSGLTCLELLHCQQLTDRMLLQASSSCPAAAVQVSLRECMSPA
jgi:hypothetical protein